MSLRPIRVAAGQMIASDLAHADAALDTIRRLAERAASERAELLVLPECAYPAYWLGSAEQFRAAQHLSTAEFLTFLSGVSVRSRLHLVCGFVEEHEGRLFNSAALLTPDGRLAGIARKTFLWDCDNRWFAPGDNISVFDTALGRIGVLICADARAPETVATLAAKGANLIAMPTAWVNVSKQPGMLYNIQPDFLIEARAREFNLPFVCADKSGLEPPLHYVGQSLLMSAAGRVIGMAPVEGESLVVGEITPTDARPPTVTAAESAALLAERPPFQNDDYKTFSPCRITAGPDGFTAGNARTALGDNSDALRFAPIRLAALYGDQVVFVRGATDIAILRARAAENRVYIAASYCDGGIIINPTGDVHVSDESAGVSAIIDISLADIKEFTPETNLWAQRRPGCFRFGL